MDARAQIRRFRAVFDPNVLVSATISAKGPPKELLHRWVGGAFQLVVSVEILFELQEVLTPDLATKCA